MKLREILEIERMSALSDLEVCAITLALWYAFSATTKKRKIEMLERILSFDLEYPNECDLLGGSRYTTEGYYIHELLRIGSKYFKPEHKEK